MIGTHDFPRSELNDDDDDDDDGYLLYAYSAVCCLSTLFMNFTGVMS